MKRLDRRKPIHTWGDLLPREKQVLVLYTAGLTMTQCGNILRMTYDTVGGTLRGLRCGIGRAGTPAATKTELLKWLEAATR